MDHLAILVKSVPLGECAKGNVAAIGLVIHQEKATVKVSLTVGNSPELLIANSKSGNLGWVWFACLEFPQKKKKQEERCEPGQHSAPLRTCELPQS